MPKYPAGKIIWFFNWDETVNLPPQRDFKAGVLSIIPLILHWNE